VLCVVVPYFTVGRVRSEIILCGSKDFQMRDQ
jgi:hypothetical protein